MYIQHNISNPYLMFACGDMAGAEKALSKVIREYKIDPHDRILGRSLALAKERS